MIPLLAQQARCFTVPLRPHALNADPIESHLLMLNLMAKQDCVQANKSDHSQSLHAPADDTPLTRTQQLV